MGEPNKEPSFADDDDHPKSRVDQITIGEIRSGWKLVVGAGGALIFVAAAIVFMIARGYESKAEAERKHSEQDAAITKVQNAVEVEQALRVMFLDAVEKVNVKFDKSNALMERIAERVGVTKVQKSGR